MKEDRFIEFLRYAKEKQEFTYDDIVRDLNLSKNEQELIVVLVRNRDLFAHHGTERVSVEILKRPDFKWYVSSNDLFKLAQYDSYKDSSMLTRCTLIITIVFSIISIIISCYQIFKNPEFPENESQKLTHIEEDISNINSSFKQTMNKNKNQITYRLDTIQTTLTKISKNQQNFSTSTKSH